jgi:hypothetical protein
MLSARRALQKPRPAQAEGKPSEERYGRSVLPAQQPRQLGDVGGDAPGLVEGSLAAALK